MTHTYIRVSEDEYQVGMWLPNREGLTMFRSLFTVSSIKQAFTAVNALNGGERVSPEALKLEEEP